MWIFLAIISILVLMIVLIGLILRARCSKGSRHKAKFVRATEQQSTLLKENGLPNTRGNNPDLIPDPGDKTYPSALTIPIKIVCILISSLKGSVVDCSDDKTEHPGAPGSGDWMFKRRSICLAPGTQASVQGTSFALSPSVHRDMQQTGQKFSDLLSFILKRYFLSFSYH